MKRGRWKDINWAKCIGIALCLWLLMYLTGCIIVGYLDEIFLGNIG